ncbi:piggyBac transposable element-derived protein 3-like [Leptopilina heterotoma]|uniref:piggyBac transposable element-derived protein 3-like n=1 Tax=Leptopilina heterotoma TaxID=63436 RepID=UPI001CA8DF88|nr:piggyBac transposable element-derived protein 3-like [Leptopilina heterotoma]
MPPKRRSDTISEKTIPSKTRRSGTKFSLRDSIEYEECDEYINANIIPSANDSGESNLDDESDCESENNFSEADDSFSFENKIMLNQIQKSKILSSTPTELFELFFSLDLKNHIVNCTEKNGYKMSITDFNVFVGIIIFTMYNKRLSQRDYWSREPHLKAEPVSSSMSRLNFETIKSKIKFHQSEDQNDADRVWRVRTLINIFRKNLIQFGIFSTALSIDEMMLKFYGRSVLKQFIKGKPKRFGIKLWALCSSNGFLFDFDVYCGKSNQKTEKLAKCALGSRVVVNMLQVVFSTVTLRKRDQLHIYFDNLFTCPDLLVHLKKYGLVATSTVRANRVEVKNAVTDKDERGKFEVKCDKQSGINFITIMDSKPVSILSSAVGVTPSGTVERRVKGQKERKELKFPRAFMIYNQFMGGVDLHDQRCNAIEPTIRSKKWTWTIFVRMIQSAMTNATILYNLCHEHKVSTKFVAMSVGKEYLNRSKVSKPDLHETEQQKLPR